MKSFRDIRILPVVLTAIFGLAVLKVAGLVIDGGYVFDYQPQSTKRSWAQDAFNFPGANKTGTADITGSIQEKPKEEATIPAASAPEVAKPNGVVVYPEQSQPVSASERAILERLQSRRQELEARAREIDIRESLLKAAEKRIESRVEELKAVEARISTSSAQKSEADAARFKGIITMYEGMKPKDWLGMARTAAAGSWSLGRACARAVQRRLGGSSLLAAGLIVTGLTFSGVCRAEPVKGEATFAAAGGFARLVLKLAEDVESE